MAYVGRPPSNAPLTSADIPDGIVTAADLAPDSVGTSEIADSVTLVTPNIGTPSAGVVTNLSGVLPAGVTGGTGLSGTILASHSMTNAAVYINSASDDVWNATGNYFSFTTNTQTNKILVDVGVNFYIYHPSANMLTGHAKIAFHDDNAAGGTPDGDDIGLERQAALYETSGSRTDLMGCLTFHGIVAVSASTAYFIQVFAKDTAAEANQWRIDECTGILLEIKA